MNKLKLLLLAGLFLACATKEKKLRPNILFIMTDDHAYQALSAYDTSLIRTPNIDRIAHEGMIFNRAYVTNSICSPSRAVALTSKFSHLNSVRDNLDVFDSTQVTFPKLLQAAGYETAVVGKWHLKSQPTGFNYWEVLPDQGHYYHPEFRTPNGIIKEEGYVTDLITEKALDFLASRKDSEQPFMLMYNHKAPHRQWWPAMEDLDAINNKEFAPPPTLFDDYATRSQAATEAEMRISDHMSLSMDTKLDPEVREAMGYDEFMNWYTPSYHERYNRLSDTEKEKWDAAYGPITKDFAASNLEGEDLLRWKYQRYLEDYLGTIQSVDRNIGRVLDFLDESGLAENTLVVYTSDQGFYLGEHGWFDKRFMYEESFRTPLLMRLPGTIQPGAQNSDLVQNIDFAPTFLEMAGVIIPEAMQGHSLAGLFEGNNTDWRDALYYHYYEFPGIHMVKRHYGVRTNRYKLIHFYHDINAWEMYDLQSDPMELNNIYNNPDYTTIQGELHNRLEQLRLEYQDSDSLNQHFINKDLKRLEALGWL